MKVRIGMKSAPLVTGSAHPELIRYKKNLNIKRTANGHIDKETRWAFYPPDGLIA